MYMDIDKNANRQNSHLKYISLLYGTLMHFLIGPLVTDAWEIGLQGSQRTETRLVWLGPLLTWIYLSSIPSTKNYKPLVTPFLWTHHWAFVSVNELGVIWKYALFSTKGNSNIIRNDYISALQHYCYY